MVQFELSKILNDTGLSTSFDEISALASSISMDTSSYISCTNNQTIGETSDTGVSVIGLPETDQTATFINSKLTNIQGRCNAIIPDLYINNVWQILIATQTLPLGWMFNSTKYAELKYERLFESWRRILLGIDPFCTHCKSFGLVVRKIGGHKNQDIVFFMVYDNPVDYQHLCTKMNEEEIDNIILMTEAEYAGNLVNGMYYHFLVKFNKSINPYTGITFSAVTKLVESVPTCVLKVGCSNSAVLYRERDCKIKNPRLNMIEFKKGSDVATSLYVPENHKIYMVSVNGASYFTGTQEFDAAGISVTETDEVVKNGYKTYTVTLSRLMADTTIFISACENLAHTQSTKYMISSASSLVVTNTDLTINLIFNKPFIYLDTSKIKVWAKRNDTTNEELVTNITYITDGRKYMERKAVFNDPDFGYPTSKHVHTDRTTFINDKYHKKRNPMERSNPNITYGIPHNEIQHEEPRITGHCIVYGINECGSLVMSFDGRAHYKYFRVEIEPEAMVCTYKVPGGPEIDVIPYIEQVRFTNEYWDTIVDDDDDDGVNNDGQSDNNTRPDVMIGSNLGISYDD